MLVSEVVVKLVEVAVSVLDAVVKVEELVNTMVVVPAPPPEIGGFNGSKWMMPDKLPPATGWPTAHPSCGPVKKTDRSDIPGVALPANIAGFSGVSVHTTPFQ